MKPVQMLVIGGVYLVRGEQHVMTAASLDRVSCVLRHITTKEECRASFEEIEGPTHLPCPYCGRIQVLKSQFGQIELAEHLDRCRFVTESKAG